MTLQKVTKPGSMTLRNFIALAVAIAPKIWPKVFPDALNAQVIAERLTERAEHITARKASASRGPNPSVDRSGAQAIEIT